MDKLRARIERALAASRPPLDPAKTPMVRRPGGDLPPQLRSRSLDSLVPAAVLVPLIERPPGLTVLLTQRAEGLKHHAGQISFPGGRLEPGDAGPLAAALRESEEEIGLAPGFVRPVGYLDTYLTISGYAVTPVVGFVSGGFIGRPDGVEVTAVFEVPLEHVLDPAQLQVQWRRYRDTELSFYEIRFGERRIWGATAAMLVNLSEKLSHAKES